MKAFNDKADWLVILGASAGGLEALESFFKHCPTDLGCAYVVIQHLSTDYKSIMNELLARYTSMPIKMVTENDKPVANVVYLIPAGTTITITQHGFEVVKKIPHQFSLPIDIFLHSAAQIYQHKAFAIILSGTGSDGSQGAIKIHQAGGVVIAQQPDDAKFNGMPNSVISTDAVDLILAADAIPKKIKEIIEHPHTCIKKDVAHDTPNPSAPHDDLQDIFSILLQCSQINFDEYKPATIERRIERRMQFRKQVDIKNYLELLLQNKSEQAQLVKEILIPVTSFFRDPEVWSLLEKNAITEIVEKADDQVGIRAWTAGVSTGEEAYSLAILILEACKSLNRHLPIKIFATDVNPKNIEIAAAGKYGPTLLADVPESHLLRYFEQTEEGYQIKPILRQCIVFAKHNLLTDAPFTRMDIVTCRNVLIYFKAETQKRVLARLQFAVTKGGYLLLGSSESLSNESVDFSAISAKYKLFRRDGISQLLELPLDLTKTKQKITLQNKKMKGHVSYDNLDVHTEVSKNILIKHFVPPSLLVNSAGKVTQFFGGVQDYIRVKQGVADLNIAKLLPDKLVPVATALLFKAKKEHRLLISEPVNIEITNQINSLMVQVLPIENLPSNEFFLISLIESIPKNIHRPPLVQLNDEIIQRINSLETELEATRENLQVTIEELETSNEELQATNEELMASNEELQSSNEELQSVNEELNTVNAEYQEKMLLMQRTNADLDTMSRSSGVATLFLDEQLLIRRYTHDVKKLFKIRESDIGRPIDEVVHILDYPKLTEDLTNTLQNSLSCEYEVCDKDNNTFLARMLPYQVKSTETKGIVLSFIDITAIKLSADLQTVINALPEHIAVLDASGTIHLTNRAWNQFAIANGDQELKTTGVGSNYLHACQKGGDDSSRAAFAGLKAVLEGSQTQFSLVYPCHSTTEKRWFVMHVKPLEHVKFCAVVSHFNITAFDQKLVLDILDNE